MGRQAWPMTRLVRQAVNDTPRAAACRLLLMLPHGSGFQLACCCCPQTSSPPCLLSAAGEQDCSQHHAGRRGRRPDHSDSHHLDGLARGHRPAAQRHPGWCGHCCTCPALQPAVPATVVATQTLSFCSRSGAVAATLLPPSLAAGYAAWCCTLRLCWCWPRYLLAPPIHSRLPCAAGLVSVTGPCAVVTPWAAFLIGAIGGTVYTFCSKFFQTKASRTAGGRLWLPRCTSEYCCAWLGPRSASWVGLPAAPWPCPPSLTAAGPHRRPSRRQLGARLLRRLGPDCRRCGQRGRRHCGTLRSPLWPLRNNCFFQA